MKKSLTCVRPFADLTSLPVRLLRHADVGVIAQTRFTHNGEVRLLPRLLVVAPLQLISPLPHAAAPAGVASARPLDSRQIDTTQTGSLVDACLLACLA